MTRRPPIKIRKTVAEQSPELEAVRKRAESSVALQERLRSQGHAQEHTKRVDAQKPEDATPKTEDSAAQEDMTPKAEDSAAHEDVTPKAEDSAAQKDVTPKAKEGAAHKKSAQQANRISLRVFVDAQADSAIKAAAVKLKQTPAYVEKAMIPKVRKALAERLKKNALDAVASEARFLLEVWNDRGGRGIETKMMITPDELATMRGYFDDPLGLQTDNSVVGSFAGAELKRLLNEL